MEYRNILFDGGSKFSVYYEGDESDTDTLTSKILAINSTVNPNSELYNRVIENKELMNIKSISYI